jgi:hypothetical protein
VQEVTARWAFVALVGCGTAPAAHPAAPTKPAVGSAATVHDDDTPAVDALSALATEPSEVSWIVPKPAVLELGGTSIDAPDAAPATQVAVLERHGNDLRVGVWLEHARFALWTDRQWLLGTVVRSTRVRGDVPEFNDLSAQEPIEAVLEPGAHVRRLAHKDSETRIRYLGVVEVDGWVADDALADRAAPHDPVGRIWDGGKTLTIVPGSVIRSEPRWASRELAVMANGYFVDEVREVDDSWSEVTYHDGDVRVHGYYGRHDPPDRIHRPNPPDSPLPPVVANAVAPSGTCLYARRGGDPVGFVVGDRDVDFEPASDGWATIAIDTPWGPVTFAAHGVDIANLAACAPPGSVPPPKPPASAPPAPPP